MRTLSNFAVTAIGAMVLALTSAGPGSAQTNFYEGKQIRIVVASAAATSYDLHARLVARFLPKYIPGNPTIIVQATGRERHRRRQLRLQCRAEGRHRHPCCAFQHGAGPGDRYAEHSI